MNLSHNARKGLAAGLAASTVLMSAMVGILPAAFAAPHAEGCLVLSSGTVYMVTGGQLRGFPSQDVFFSHGNGFGGVQPASAEDLALPMGPVLVYADGTLVKGPNDPLVYLVANGQKRGFTSGDVFTGLGFKFSNIQSAPANTFADLPTGANLDSATERHTTGVWVIDSTGTVWRMTATGRVGLPSMEVFNSWGKSFATVVAANAADMAAPVEGVASAKPSCSSPVTPQPGPMSVSFSGPASQTFINTSVTNNLADFVFSGNGTVTSVTFERIGVSGSSTLSGVYLFDGPNRLTDSASVGSDNKVTFGGQSLFTVSGSKTISVKADIGNATGQTVGMKLVSYTVSGGSATSVSVSGNIHTIAANPGIATAGFTTNVATHAGDTDPVNDVTVWQSQVAVSRDVSITRLALHQIGSVQTSDIRNFRLFADGVQIASTSNIDSNSYVTFNVSPSKTLTTGTKTLRVSADIIGGSGRNYRFSLDGAYDVTFVDNQYNVNIAATVTGGTTAFPVRAAAAGSISSGATTTIRTTDSPSGNVVLGASDQVLGRFRITATGEPVKINQLEVNTIATSTADFRNGRLLINGVQYGSTTTLNTDTSGNGGADTDFTVNYTVMPGSPITVEVRADMVKGDGSQWSDGNVAKVTLALMGAENATAQTSVTSVFVPTADVVGNDLTIKSGSLTVAQNTNYGSRNVVVPQTAYKLGSFNISNGNTEDVNINTFTVTYTAADGAANGANFTAADLTNVYLVYGGSLQTSMKSQATGGGDAFSVSYTLPKNGATTVDVYGNVGSQVDADDTLRLNLDVTAVTALSGTNAYTGGAVSGQVLTAKTGGSISATLDASSPVAQNVYDNQTVTAGAFKFTAVDDSFTLTDVRVALSSTSAVLTVTLKDGSTVLGTKPAASNVDFNGLNVVVPANASKVLTVDLTIGNVGTGAGSTGSAITVSLPDTSANVKATGVASGVTNVTISTVSGNAMYAYAAVPTLTKVATTSGAGSLQSGTRDLAKFTVTANGGTVSWDKVTVGLTGKLAGAVIGDSDGTPSVLVVTTGTGTTAINTFSVVDENGSSVAGTFATTNTTSSGSTITFTPTSEQQVSSSKTYTLKGNIAVAVTTGDSLIVSLSYGDTQHRNPAVAASVHASANFVWSDQAIVPHSTTSADWNNDWLLKNTLDTWGYNY